MWIESVLHKPTNTPADTKNDVTQKIYELQND